MSKRLDDEEQGNEEPPIEELDCRAAEVLAGEKAHTNEDVLASHEDQ